MIDATCELMRGVPKGKKEAVKHGDVLGVWGLKKFDPKLYRSKGDGGLLNYKEEGLTCL